MCTKCWLNSAPHPNFRERGVLLRWTMDAARRCKNARQQKGTFDGTLSTFSGGGGLGHFGPQKVVFAKRDCERGIEVFGYSWGSPLLKEVARRCWNGVAVSAERRSLCLNNAQFVAGMSDMWPYWCAISTKRIYFAPLITLMFRPVSGSVFGQISSFGFGQKYLCCQHCTAHV